MPQPGGTSCFPEPPGLSPREADSLQLCGLPWIKCWWAQTYGSHLYPRGLAPALCSSRFVPTELRGRSKDKEASGIQVFHQWAAKSNPEPAVFQWALNDIKPERITRPSRWLLPVPFVLAQNLRALSPGNNSSGRSAGFATDRNFPSNLNNRQLLHGISGKIRGCS